jgi:hypothetical protein
MKKDEGYIKLWRKSRTSDVWLDHDLWRLWTLCLMKAAFKKRKVPIESHNEPIEIKPGQFVTGRNSLHKDYYGKRRSRRNVHPTTLWNWLKVLQKFGNIKIQSEANYSIVTIVNWKEYQQDDLAPRVTETNETEPGKEKATLVAKVLLDQIKKWKANFKEPTPATFKKWVNTCDLVLRKDKRDFEKTLALVKWATTNVSDRKGWSGWQRILLSPNSLRKHYDTIEAQMHAKMKGASQQVEKGQDYTKGLKGMTFAGEDTGQCNHDESKGVK